MSAPRMRPFSVTMILMKPSRRCSAWARSFSDNGQRRMPDRPLCARRRFVQPDMGQLGIGEGDPGQGGEIHLRRQAEQRVADDDAGVIGGQMRELRPARHIAHGKDALVRGPQPPVDGMPLSLWATPASSRPRSLTRARRPAATSRCEPSRRRRDPSFSISSAIRASDLSRADNLVALIAGSHRRQSGRGAPHLPLRHRPWAGSSSSRRC